MTKSTIFRVLIIEDEIIIGRYIQMMLTEHFDCDAHLALSSEEAVSEADSFLPHLILCDINLHEKKDGIELITMLKKTLHFETIFITSYQAKSMVEKASSTEPVNYLIKPIDENQFVASLQTTFTRLQNNKTVGQKIVHLNDSLSRSEVDILKLIAENKSSKEIAEALFISPLTVKNHRHSISRKLQLSPDNNALTKWVMEHKKLIGK
jgi:DNA-binding NarL/FixJ family response regulator